MIACLRDGVPVEVQSGAKPSGAAELGALSSCGGHAEAAERYLRSPTSLGGATLAAGLDLGPWALHGASVFTTIRVQRGERLHWDRHLRRLRQDAAALGFPHPGDAALEADWEALSRRLGEGRLALLRLTLTDSFRLAQLSAYEPPPRAAYTQGVNVSITPIRIHPDLGRHKTGNYLPYRLARAHAEARGAFEGLLLDHRGDVVDGSRTSPLLVASEELTILEGGLEGITRAVVAEAARELGLEVRRERRTANELAALLQPARGESEHERSATGPDTWSQRSAGESGGWRCGRSEQILLAGSGVGLVPVGPPSSSLVTTLIEKFRPM